MRRVHAARVSASVVAAAAVIALAGCTPTVSTITPTPDPQATSIACASLIVGIAHQTLGTAAPRAVNAQGTAAWGDPLAVTLYCGVALSPSADPCYTYDGVDWKLAEQTSGGVAYEVLTTVGRAPVVQVEVDPDHASINDVLPPVSDAVKTATAKSGLGCTSAGSSPSPTP